MSRNDCYVSHCMSSLCLGYVADFSSSSLFNVQICAYVCIEIFWFVVLLYFTVSIDGLKLFLVELTFVLWAISRISRLFGIELSFYFHYLVAEWIVGQGRGSLLIWGFNPNWFMIWKSYVMLVLGMLISELLFLF